MGEGYILREVSAPEGFQVAEDVTFNVEEITEVQTITMEDERTPDQPEEPDELEIPDEPAEPVSYTHLDVYKRQPLLFVRCSHIHSKTACRGFESFCPCHLYWNKMIPVRKKPGIPGFFRVLRAKIGPSRRDVFE